jgi:hypothetical protein
MSDDDVRDAFELWPDFEIDAEEDRRLSIRGTLVSELIGGGVA